MSMDEMRERVEQAREELKKIREGLLAELTARKKDLAGQVVRVRQARNRVELVRRALEASKREARADSELVRRLEHSNGRREERLGRVRRKDLHRKEEVVKAEYCQSCAVVQQSAEELCSRRKAFIADALRHVFPIEVESLSQRDEGEDYQGESQIDCDSVREVEGGWVLGGLHTLPTPHIRIVTAALRADGDHTSYLTAARTRRKARRELARTGVDRPIVSSDPRDDPAVSTPAALVYTTHFVELIAETLSLPLPYPMSRQLAISEYGNPDRRSREFLDSVAKLDDNIIYLCFSQAVPLSALTPGHTLSNLLALVTHTQLGRTGAFTCTPSLTRHLLPDVSADSEEPPALLYTGCHDNSDSSESDSVSEGDWEPVEAPPTATPPHGNYSIELEAQREKMRHLDYNSTYLDYMDHSSTVPSGPADVASQGGTEGHGLIGTFSSLWSSAFGRTT